MKKDRRIYIPTSHPKKGSKERKKWSKKKKIIFFSAVAVFLICALTVGLCLYFFVFDKEEKYYKNFTSTGSINNIRCCVTLPDGVTVSSYDTVSQTFILEKTYSGSDLTDVTLYGLADEKEVYVEPRYTNVIALRGDYAVVTLRDSTGTDYIGVIKFRGEGTLDGGVRKPVAVSDFTVENNDNDEQLYFCGEYICMLGDKENPSVNAQYTTFYEYKSHNRLLECFRIRYGYDATNDENYKIIQEDDYVVAYGTATAYFFDITADCYGGYLELSDTASYKPFSLLSDSELLDCSQSLAVYYMGNGWFMRYAELYSESIFDGHNLGYNTLDDEGNSVYLFARTKTDFYNVKTGVTKQINQFAGIVNVANKYTSDAFAMVASSYNGQSFLTETGRVTYELPCVNPARIMEEGYSCVYYYYRPYIDKLKDATGDEAALATMGEMTYCIMDENLNVILPDPQYPVLFVDGVGVETSDPSFDPVYGDITVYDEDLKGTVILKHDERYTYSPVSVNQDGILIVRLDSVAAKQAKEAEKAAEEETEEEESEEEEDEEEIIYLLYGALTQEGYIIVDCKYEELTPFYGGYAVGFRDGKTYRIDGKGKEEELTDVYAVKDGVYIFTEGGKKGLKNFAGKVLLEAKYDVIAVSDNYMTDEEYQTSYVMATEGTQSVIYRLGEK